MNRIEFKNTPLFKYGHFEFEQESSFGEVYILGDIGHHNNWYLLKITEDGLRRCVAIASDILDIDKQGSLLVVGVDIIE